MAGMSSICTAWLESVSTCCGVSRREHDDEKGLEVLHDQPFVAAPPPSYELVRSETRGSAHARTVLRRKSSRGIWEPRPSISSRKRAGSSNASSRRPRISNPTNFRHIQSESFQFPRSTPPLPSQAEFANTRQRSFRPLQLSIYDPQNRLSPLLPHFDHNLPSIPPPPPAARSRSGSNESEHSLHSRSYSAMSFHVPRRAVAQQSSFASAAEQATAAPAIPPKAHTRPRAYTSPSVEAIVERIATAMNEMERLQEEIEDVIERQSVYISSRPTTAYGIPDADCLPEVPALPAASAPSFAERLSSERPQTAPSKAGVAIPHRAKSFKEASAVFSSSDNQTFIVAHEPEAMPPMALPVLNRSNHSLNQQPLAPPLPLVLRPPLRKKKSFSRVSNWLSRTDSQRSGLHPLQMNSIDGVPIAITNAPKAITRKEGFYHTVTQQHDNRHSNYTITSGTSTWQTDADDQHSESEDATERENRFDRAETRSEIHSEAYDEEEEEDEGAETIPTSWSPSSTPITKTENVTPTSMLARTATFGHAPSPRTPRSVGVAF